VKILLLAVALSACYTEREPDLRAPDADECADRKCSTPGTHAVYVRMARKDDSFCICTEIPHR